MSNPVEDLEKLLTAYRDARQEFLQSLEDVDRKKASVDAIARELNLLKINPYPLPPMDGLSEDDLGSAVSSISAQFLKPLLEVYKFLLELHPNNYGLSRASKDMEEMIGRNFHFSAHSSGLLILDDVAAENSANKTQDQWIGYWNKITDGRWFPDLGDIVQWNEQAMAEPEKYQKTLVSLRKDFDEKWLVLSNRIIYDKKDLSGKIIHHYGSTLQESPIELENIPVWRDEPISNVLSDSRGLAYLQALIKKAYSPREIIDIFKFLSGKPKEDIRIWTAHTSNEWPRSKYPGRAVSLNYNGGRFLINGVSILYGNGRSCGVRLASAASV